MDEIKMRVSGVEKSFPGVKALSGIDFAVRKGVSLSGRNGILQKRDALSAHISKKHRGMIEFVGQVRNAADHGADPDENNQVWTISNETARIYPCIIAALIKAIFSRDATGSIEV